MVISILSGKGGVGKSVIAVNLAETLVAEGRSVALLDADAGQNSCATLLNETPERDILAAGGDLRRAWHVCSSGLVLFTAAIEPPGNLAATERVRAALRLHLDVLSEAHEIVIIDTPAGVGEDVRWAAEVSDLGLLVLTDEPTAIADAYRLSKLAWERDPRKAIGAVVNWAESDAHGRDVWNRFSLVTRRFTGNGSFYLGSVRFSTEVRRSVADQQPVIRSSPEMNGAFGTIAAAACERAQHAARGLHPH